MSNTATITADLPITFYDDHAGRDLPSGKVIKRLAKKVRVELDREAYNDLLDDARYYADPYGPRDFDNAAGLVASARATVKRLEAYGPADFTG